MNPLLKIAYDFGRQACLADYGLDKQAGLPRGAMAAFRAGKDSTSHGMEYLRARLASRASGVAAGKPRTNNLGRPIGEVVPGVGTANNAPYARYHRDVAATKDLPIAFAPNPPTIRSLTTEQHAAGVLQQRGVTMREYSRGLLPT